jgi:hypothetical protein
VLDALAEAAESLGRAPVWMDALERLLAVVGDRAAQDKARLNAALFARRRASGSRLAARDEMLGRLVQAAAGPPFTEHSELRRELRRLTRSKPTAAGGGR